MVSLICFLLSPDIIKSRVFIKLTKFSILNSLLQIHSSDDAAEHLVPKSEVDMKVILIRVTDLPKLAGPTSQTSASL